MVGVNHLLRQQVNLGCVWFKNKFVGHLEININIKRLHPVLKKWTDKMAVCQFIFFLTILYYGWLPPTNSYHSQECIFPGRKWGTAFC